MSLADVTEGIRTCQGCPLAHQRRHAVPGEGNPEARVFFIGEAPGYQEDQEGRPFIGPAGEVLEEELLSIGLAREDVYIANVLNCRPPNNRDPRKSELDICRYWLEAQIAEVPFEILVAMGRYASLAVCPDVKPKLLRGTAHARGGLTEYFVLHPAATLHNPDMRPQLDLEFQRLGELLG